MTTDISHTLAHVANWALNGIIRPLVIWLIDNLFSRGHDVGNFLGAHVKAVLGGLWRWWKDLWWPLMGVRFRPAIDPRWLTGSPPLGIVFASLFQYPANAILGTVLSWVHWIRDRIMDARRYIEGRLNAWSHWVRDRVRDYARWIRDRVVDARNWLEGRLGAWSRWARDRVNDARNVVGGWITAARNSVGGWIIAARNTVGGWITAARNTVVDRIWGAVVAGAQELVGGLRDAFNFIFDKVNAAITGLGNIIVAGFQTVFLGPADALINTVQKKLAIPGRLIRGEYPNLQAFLDDLTDPGPAILAALVGAIALGMIISITTASIMTILVEPLTEPHAQEIRKGVGAQLLQPTVLEEVRNRELVDDALVDDHLARAGYSGAVREALKELRHKIPGQSDLVRFAVREAFDRGLADQLGFITPLPGDFAVWMERQGFDQEWSERFWWSHWDLPSVTQGFDMLHRGVINLEDLKLLLRAKDVAPLWQDRLVDIAFTLPSRVDLRRMLKVGIITEAEVLKGYTERGYDTFWARALTDFAVDWANPEEDSEIDELRELTGSQIRLSYRRNIIDRDEALDRLVLAGYGESTGDFLLTLDDAQIARNPYIDADVDVRELTRSVILEAYREGVWERDRAQLELEAQGYLPGSADLLLTLEDLVNARSLTRTQVALVRQRYVTYEITAADARAELAEIGSPVGRQEILLAEWAIDRQAGTRTLSLAQIRNALDRGLIDQDDGLEKTLRLGYSLEDATVIRVLDEPDLDATRELSRALVERLLRAGQLTEAEAVDRLERLGFTMDDASAIVATTTRLLERGLVERLLKQGLIDRDDALGRLARAGFTPPDAELIVLSVEAKGA